MRQSVFISHGRTESGDDIPMVAWSQEPDGEALIAHYSDILSEEFEAFGEEFVAGQIEVTEVKDWGS